MRYVAPPREMVERAVFARRPLLDWVEHADLLQGEQWPTIEALNQRRALGSDWCFVGQTPTLLADGLHYEQRIAERGEIATREGSWHDLFNALMWLRHAALKHAMNARQMVEIARMGPKQRSRAQYALTHFDEGGVLVTLRDPALLALWDEHDWHSLFWRHRTAWHDGTASVQVFGHALLELALDPHKLLVGKALVRMLPRGMSVDDAPIDGAVARAIAAANTLNDPLDLRPLPLSGLPGWHPDSASETFHLTTPCYQPRRAGRCYPPPMAE